LQGPKLGAAPQYHGKTSGAREIETELKLKRFACLQLVFEKIRFLDFQKFENWPDTFRVWDVACCLPAMRWTRVENHTGGLSRICLPTNALMHTMRPLARVHCFLAGFA